MPSVGIPTWPKTAALQMYHGFARLLGRQDPQPGTSTDLCGCLHFFRFGNASLYIHGNMFAPSFCWCNRLQVVASPPSACQSLNANWIQELILVHSAVRPDCLAPTVATCAVEQLIAGQKEHSALPPTNPLEGYLPRGPLVRSSLVDRKMQAQQRRHEQSKRMACRALQETQPGSTLL